MNQEVAQPNAKVVQPEAETSIESHLSAIQSSINGMKNILFHNNSIFNSESTKEVEGKAEVGIRTQVVASTGRLFLTNVPRCVLL